MDSATQTVIAQGWFPSWWLAPLVNQNGTVGEPNAGDDNDEHSRPHHIREHILRTAPVGYRQTPESVHRHGRPDRRLDPGRRVRHRRERSVLCQPWLQGHGHRQAGQRHRPRHVSVRRGAASLDAYRPILLDVQKGVCLYCRKPLSKQSQVDHFVPWSRYPADLGHNFVLAHDKCNNAKSDFLAAENHLAAWMKRNPEHQAEL